MLGLKVCSLALNAVAVFSPLCCPFHLTDNGLLGWRSAGVWAAWREAESGLETLAWRGPAASGEEGGVALAKLLPTTMECSLGEEFRRFQKHKLGHPSFSPSLLPAALSSQSLAPWVMHAFSGGNGHSTKTSFPRVQKLTWLSSAGATHCPVPALKYDHDSCGSGKGEKINQNTTSLCVIL